MEYYTLARVLHVLAVIIWIGGVGMVTMVIIPAIKRMKSAEDQIQTFEQIEGRFAFVAKTMTILTAATGFYMLYVLDAWSRYTDPRHWWLHAMTLVWVIFRWCYSSLSLLCCTDYLGNTQQRTRRALSKSCTGCIGCC